MWSTICSGWLQSQAAESLSPHPFMVAKQPTPVLRRLSIVHCRCGRSMPGSSSGSTNLCSLNWSAACYSSIQRHMSQSHLEKSSGVECRCWRACSANGCCDFRRACGGISVAVLWRRWSSSLVAFRDRGGQLLLGTALAVRCRQKSGVGWPEWRAGNRRLTCKAVLSVVSSFLVWELLHQTGEQYSVTEKTCAWVEVCRVLVKVPQVVPDRQCIRATRADVLADKFSRCWRNVSMQSSLTLRYVRAAWNWSLLLSTVMLSSWLASRLFRWNTEDIILATESFRRQFVR